MSDETWSFVEFVEWLRGKSEAFEREGALVEFNVVQDASIGSVRLRVEHGERLGELVAWREYGWAALIVADLRSGDYLLSRDPVSLVGIPWASVLKDFFDLMESVSQDR